MDNNKKFENLILLGGGIPKNCSLEEIKKILSEKDISFKYVENSKNIMTKLGVIPKHQKYNNEIWITDHDKEDKYSLGKYNGELFWSIWIN